MGRARAGCGLAALVLIGGGAYVVIGKGREAARLEPTARGPAKRVRFQEPTDLLTAFRALGPTIVRDPEAAAEWARDNGRNDPVRPGTYDVPGGLMVGRVIDRLRLPVVVKVRIPETNWARRTARLLEKKGVTSADEYMRLVASPSDVSHGLPWRPKTLEGVLFPDTYEFSPGGPAKAVIEEQIAAFRKKVLARAPQAKDWPRVLTIASLIELETGGDGDRATISAVIRNRLRKGMPLQIDASLLYGIQKWRRLTYRDYRTIPGPYNLYRVKGLPPGPICSPSWKSVGAALNPSDSDALYYVAIPGKGTVFSRSFTEHKTRVKALRAAGR